MTARIRIGTSGWHYPKGRGTWDGIFYPLPSERPRGFDELAFYAEHFDTVEVNSTFYGQPRPEVCRTWAARTPPGFEFAMKLYQKFTHPRMFAERVTQSLPEDVRGDTGVVHALAQPTQTDLDTFRRGIAPLAEAGKLGVLLAQFPPSFKEDAAGCDYLNGLLGAFGQYPVAVELRHRSWSDRLDDTLALLAQHGAAWTQIDEPRFASSIRQNRLPNVGSFYYMRLHGRNAGQWWRHDQPEDRYNYFYTSEELQDVSTTIDGVRPLVKKVYLYTNNHFSAKSVANAAMIKRQLDEPVDGVYSAAFLARYPELVRGVRGGGTAGVRVTP